MTFPRADPEWVVRVGSILLIGIGVMGLLGWVFGWTAVLQVPPGVEYFSADTVSCSILAGIAFIAQLRRSVLLSRLSGGVLAIFSASHLIADIQQRYFSIHQLFPSFTAAVVFPRPIEGLRLAIPVAVVLLLLGLFLVFIAEKAPSPYALRIAAALVPSIVAACLLAVAIHLTGFSELFSWPSFLLKGSTLSQISVCVASVTACALLWMKSGDGAEHLLFAGISFSIIGLLICFAGTDLITILAGSQSSTANSDIESITRNIGLVRDIKEFTRITEAGQRGFLLTGDKFYLNDYQTGSIKANAALQELGSFPGGYESTERLRSLTNEKLAELAMTIALAKRASDGKAAALEIEKSGRGLSLMSQIDSEASALTRELDSKLQNNVQAHQQTLRHMQWAVFVSYAFTLGLITISLSLLQKQIRRRFRLEADLREAARDLEMKVADRTAELGKQAEELQLQIARRLLSETALLESDERLQTAFSFSKMAAWVRRFSDDLMIWSGPVEEIFGTAQLNSYSEFLKAVFPDDRDRLSQEVTDCVRSKSKYSTEYRILHPSGEIRWMSTLGDFAYDDNGLCYQMAGICFDVTERRRIEQKLKDSEQHFRELANAVPEIVWTSDANGKFEYFNDRWYEITGLPRDRVSQYPDADKVLHPQDFSLWAAKCSAARQQEQPYEIEFRVRHVLREEYRWYFGRALPIRDSNGAVVRWLCTCTDIHERKMVEMELAASERRLRQQADAMPQIVWTATPQGDVEYFNQRWYEYTGFSVERSSAQGWFDGVHADDLQECWKGCARGFASGSAFELEVRLRQATDSTYRWHLLRAVPSRDGQGELLRWFGTCTDIHEQKEQNALLEQEVQLRTSSLRESLERLQEREDELRHSLTEKETLLREIHHRVKNNLQVISSLLRMQASVLQDRKAKEALEDSQRRVRSMALIHERLYGSHQLDQIDFAEYAKTLVTELFTSYAIGRQVTSRVEISRVLLNIDQAIPCGLIVNELVTNALKYAYPNGERGEITIRLEEENGSGQVSLSVIDKGIGLPEGFDWKSTKSMGLPIVGILARQIGGELHVQSGPETAFTVSFPRELKETEVGEEI